MAALPGDARRRKCRGLIGLYCKPLLLVGIMAASVAAASEGEFGKVEVSSDPQEVVASLQITDCRATLEHHLRWNSLRYRNSCQQPLAEKAAVFSRLAAALAQKVGIPQDITSLGLGRLIYFPELAQRLALMARESPAWDSSRGGVRDRQEEDFGAVNRLIEGLAVEGNLFKALEGALRDYGWTVSAVETEKVLVGKPDQTPFAEGLFNGGARADDKLPFDAIVWLRLRRLAEP
jgi:hypothetical protein